MTFKSTKTYGHELGLSAVFRQHRATSHCNKLHGYALAVKLVFASDTLDSRNWVVDFGALKAVKKNLVDSFDHKCLIARDDPHVEEFLRLHTLGLADVEIVPAVGCEAWAKSIFEWVAQWLDDVYYRELAIAGVSQPKNLRIESCEVREHGANSAIYTGPVNSESKPS